MGEVTRPKAEAFVQQSPADSLERVGERLFAETGGQPFYLIETLKLLLERGHFTPGEDVAAVVRELGVSRLFPPSVRELVSLQLDRLSPAAFAFLVAEAVLEQDATFARLCEVAWCTSQSGRAGSQAMKSLPSPTT